MADRRLKLVYDAIAAIDPARSFLGETDFEGYCASLLLRSAVERQLEILGEAAARLDRLDAGACARMPALRLATGLRNRIIHGYDAVDDEIVYRVVREDLPALQQALQGELDQLAADDSGG
jgi:uncharacterized protein with HEPN domain